MKKLLGIVVLGLFWCNVGFAEWKEVATSDRGAIYIDTQTVAKIDNNFIFMQLFSYTIPIKVSGTTWYSDISKVELDCTNWPFNNFRELSTTYYEKKMGKGRHYKIQLINISDWKKATPGSAMMFVGDYLCK